MTDRTQAKDAAVKLIQGDCLEALRGMSADSIDAVVTDPPYELGFMGKAWDATGIAYNPDLWREVLRVLKPGGHLLSFGGSRTYHRMACAIEDAGFEVRDQIQWLYGSGFPKSLNVSKAIDKANGDFGEQWSGWGTALKPAHEPMVLARKPLSEKTVAANVLRWGTGGINVDGTRIEYNGPVKHCERQDTEEKINPGGWREVKRTANRPATATATATATAIGRFPANLILGCACPTDQHEIDCVVSLLDGQSIAGGMHSAGKSRGKGQAKQEGDGALFGVRNHEGNGVRIGDTGGASRFFYTAKTSKSERNAGLEGMPERRGGAEQFDSRWKDGVGEGRMPLRQNFHPTVKPIKLMRYLCRLVTPPGGTVLDPFMGSGSTGCAARKEGFKFIGIEREPDYLAIAMKRINHADQE